MSKKTMWLATEEHGEFVLCPDSPLTMTPTGWRNDGMFLNGGGFTSKSITTHRRGQASFSGDVEDVQGVLDFVAGQFGSGPFHMVDPFSYKNILPPWIAAPRLMGVDAPSFTVDSDQINIRPTLEDTAPNSVRLPSKSAEFTVSSSVDSRSFSFVVPDDYSAKLFWWGSVTGGGVLQIDTDTIPPGSATSEIPAGKYDLSVTYDTTPGTVLISGIVVQLQRPGGTWDFSKFYSGRGTTEVDLFVSQYTGYSAIRGRVSATVDIVEIGGWK